MWARRFSDILRRMTDRAAPAWAVPVAFVVGGGLAWGVVMLSSGAPPAVEEVEPFLRTPQRVERDLVKSEAIASAARAGACLRAAGRRLERFHATSDGSEILRGEQQRSSSCDSAARSSGDLSPQRRPPQRADDPLPGRSRTTRPTRRREQRAQTAAPARPGRRRGGEAGRVPAAAHPGRRAGGPRFVAWQAHRGEYVRARYALSDSSEAGSSSRRMTRISSDSRGADSSSRRMTRISSDSCGAGASSRRMTQRLL